MIQKEVELRTNNHNLLMCMINCDENGRFFLELKSGKRRDCISLEQFIDKINQFMEENNVKSHIVYE